MDKTLKLGNEGTAKLGGIGFAYKLSTVHKKNIAKMGYKFLEIIVPYRSMMFSSIAQVRIAQLKEAESFMGLCKELIQSIFEKNPVLTEWISKENSIDLQHGKVEDKVEEPLSASR